MLTPAGGEQGSGVEGENSGRLGVLLMVFDFGGHLSSQAGHHALSHTHEERHQYWC